jgi:hypothetical protein
LSHQQGHTCAIEVITSTTSSHQWHNKCDFTLVTPSRDKLKVTNVPEKPGKTLYQQSCHTNKVVTPIKSSRQLSHHTNKVVTLMSQHKVTLVPVQLSHQQGHTCDNKLVTPKRRHTNKVIADIRHVLFDLLISVTPLRIASQESRSVSNVIKLFTAVIYEFS